MDFDQWEMIRQLEQKLIKLDHELVRLMESNANLHRLNGFIFSAILLEIIMIIYNGGR